MIYLIGGSPRCGKTTIARRLAEKLGTAWISADAIESVVAAYTRPADIARLFPKGVIRKQTRMSNDIMYAKHSTDKITAAYIKQSKTSWTAMDVLVKCALQEEHDLIIEGHQIHPQFISKMVKKYKKVKGIIIVRTNLKKIVTGALKGQAKNDWFIKKTKNPETFEKIGLMIKAYSDYFISESKKYRIKVINTDSNFSSQVKLAVNYLK